MPERRRKNAAPVTLGGPLEAAMGKIDPMRGRLRTILQVWRDIVGEEAFLHARPSSIRKGVLTVTVSDPIWQSELRYFNETFLLKINGELPAADGIEKIRYRLGYLEGAWPHEDEKRSEAVREEKRIEDLPLPCGAPSRRWATPR